MLIDLQKAYDSVDRELLWRILDSRCRDEDQKKIVRLMIKLHRESDIIIGDQHINAEIGLPQGSILSPVLFNVYLEEAIKSSKKLEEVRSRGDLLAFADDMLVMSNAKGEMTWIINELDKLKDKWNLRLNKKKCEILTREPIESMCGVKCTKSVKYLGVRVVTDRKDQLRVAQE